MRLAGSLVGVLLLLALPAPAATGEEATVSLTLRQAVERALLQNLSVRLSRERVQEARGTAAAARAPLLPTLSLTGSQANEVTNVASLGLNTVLPIHKYVVGPFYSFDARLRLAQTIFNESAVFRARSGRASITLARLREALQREQTAAAVETSYVDLLRSERAVRDAEANVILSTSLLRLASDQQNAGIGTGVDVTRAETQLAQDQSKLESAQGTLEQDRLKFQRLVGLPLGGPLRLADALAVTEAPAPELEALLDSARKLRPEAQVAREQVSIAGLDLRAAQAEGGPTVSLSADLGFSGSSPWSNAAGVHTVTMNLNIPIYNGGLTHADVWSARSRLEQSKLQLLDVYDQIEQDVRQSLIALRVARTQVETAARQVALADRQLEMARDRFGAGLGDNVEVVTAQAALEDARDQQTLALTQYNVARINLAASVGRATRFNDGGTP